MPTLNPDHLLDQARKLIHPPAAGPPRQVDIRRAISAAYYAVFHAIVTAAADQFVGVTLRNTPEHGLVCRSLDHRTIKATCEDLVKATVPAKYRPYVPGGGFGMEVSTLMRLFPNLQERRHDADYDTLERFRTADAASEIAVANAALHALTTAPASDRRAFLFLLLFPPRR